jgi:hypothetical protein
MRTFLRTLAATAALSALLLGAGASSALAASDQGNPAHTYRYVFSDNYCNDNGVVVDCFAVDGFVSAATTPSGRDIARIVYSSDVTRFDESGLQIGSDSMTSLERWITVENGTSSVFVIEHHRVSSDGQDCAYGYKLQIVDFELRMERYTGPGCN